jgi:FkbM family methyltransferase
MPTRPIILDFGMHHGEDTDFYLACGAHVIAFEANADLVKRNSSTFAQAIAEARLEIVPGAVVAPDFAGTEQTFYVNNSKSVWGTTSSRWAERNNALGSDVVAVTVPTVDLKRMLSERGDVLYAKIDIEGADPFVLQTFEATGTTPEFISIESDKLELQSVIAEIETLQDLGYTRFAAVQQATIPGSRIRGRTLDGTPLKYRFKKHASGPFGPYLKQDFSPAGEIIDQYRSIFRSYRRFGDQSWLMRFSPTRLVVRTANAALVKTVRIPLCGWYDTHAAR